MRLRRPRPAMGVLLLAIVGCGAVRALGCASKDGGGEDQGLVLPQRDPFGNEDAGDAAEGAAPPIDASLDGRTTCDVRAPFTEIVPLPALSTPVDEALAQLRQDESVAFVARGANVALYDRQPGGGWTGGSGVEINTGNADNPRMTDDLLSVYYNVYLGGGTNASRLFVTTRGTTSGAFGNNNQLQLGAQPGEGDSEPFVLPGQQTVYFTTTRNDAGARQLWFAKRAGAGGAWAAPSAVPGVGSAAGERRAVVTADERVIYFASERTAGAKLNVFVGVRGDAMAAFQVSEVTELSTADDEYPTWVSPDLCRVYFASDRPGGTGKRDLWLASRKP